ncbi:MAG: hypothetical protein Q7S40_22735 [Opitutaceae bacterium]|nr:hypothetical protein [Opitutaceae bacterium]
MNLATAPAMLCYDAGVNDHDYHQLLTSLDSALEILEQNRTPDSAVVAAFDTLK